jgi:hypothetical protein
MNRTKHEEWLKQAINLVPDEVCKDEIRKYLQPLLSRCQSSTRKRFWQWLRLQLSKHEWTSAYLCWMQEARCPLEVHQGANGFEHTLNGDIALIKVKDDTIWCIPSSVLNWAQSLYPVSLDNGRLVKYWNGTKQYVHRLYLNAGEADEVAAYDGNFLNFTDTRITVTTSIKTESGIGIFKGNRPVTETVSLTLPNLYIQNSEAAQKMFEKAILQAKTTPQGDIDTHLPIQPNVLEAWRTAGKHEPLSAEEQIQHGICTVTPVGKIDKLGDATSWSRIGEAEK